LPRLVGPARAKDLLFSGRFVGAGEALRIGLVDRVVPAAEVYPAALAWAGEFVGRPAPALRAAKNAVDRGLDLD
jgi:enoyl-CoA hydratase/carnithine racemase